MFQTLPLNFSIALNVYLQVLAFISNLVCHALQHDQPDWQLKHGCPAYGNDSLKQVVTRILDGNINDAATSLPTSEHTFHHEQYLTHEFVNKFASNQQTGHSLINEDSDDNLCVECWKNVKDSATQKMWNVFNESGVFITVCQHGFCLLIADMVQSSEQSKYALVVTSKLMDAFGSDLRGGYDIGCWFKTTLASSVLGKCACSLNYTSLINTFHSHAHNRLCQLDNLMTYIKGLGLEDLEGCEWAFSKSNALVSSTQCREGSLPTSDPVTFKVWLDKEQLYLKSLLHEPPEETLQMEYWQWLVNLATSRQELETILSTWTVITTQNVAPIWSDSSATRKRETTCCHAQENYEKDLKAVQELEGHLGITYHWVPEDEEWQAAAHLVTNRKYQCTLDNVKRLVVSWIFKLSKMNQSGTGYKLHKHIGKALQTCSVAIQATLMQYNSAAKALGHQTLEFDEVVEYAFLADFDLLRDMQQDISSQPWASPTGRLAVNTYFKLCQAEEEVICLNVEIHQVATYLKISHLPGFSGMLTLGISMSHGLGDSAGVPQQVQMEAILSSMPVGADDGEEDVDEDTNDDHATTLEEQYITGANKDRSGDHVTTRPLNGEYLN
ncbi:hypothetical protein BKA83DRAFT_4466258 [Pisolithus microcarpus]|nr:hypothetical protein BKA83DRAFT_4466258 [Pisolithus microcarpus]